LFGIACVADAGLGANHARCEVEGQHANSPSHCKALHCYRDGDVAAALESAT
jgi:hypothetical protein